MPWDTLVTPVTVSLVILVVTYILLFLDKIHRTIISLAGATAMVFAGKLLGFYHTLPEPDEPVEGTVLGAIDWNTIWLLFGMMVIVGILEETGIFEYIAIKLAKLTRGRYWPLMLSLGWFTFIASALLDNVTTIIFVSSITVSIASILRVNPVPLLISEAIMSGIGGMATLVGDPPNIIIGSAAGLTFLDFVIYLGTVAVIIGAVTSVVFRWIFRNDIAHQEVRDLEGLMALDENAALRDRRTLVKMLIVFGVVLLLFVLHGKLDLLPSEVAVAGAAAALLWVRPHLIEVLNRTKWDVLLFFAGLFVIIGGLEAAGILGTVAGWIGGAVLAYPVLALLVILWGSALLSAIVDNIPFTIALVPILLNLEGMGADVFPLWWALAAGVAIGGCATPIGASANIYVLSLAERSGHPIGFQRWLRIGIPTVLVLLLVTSLLLYGMYQLGII
jgi:Na+/H+ antiporter NhaD/arsenite permease-like protein